MLAQINTNLRKKKKCISLLLAFHSAFTCSKLTTETLELGLKNVQS